MKRLATTIVAIVLLASVVTRADPPKITGPDRVEPYRFAELTIEGAGADDIIFWDVSPEETGDLRDAGSKLLFVAPPGTYRFRAKVIPVKDGKISGKATDLRHTLVIGTPKPPVPPGPEPPGPNPPPPIPAPGFRVLIIEDAANRTKLSTLQQNILFDRGIRDYLNNKCIMGADGKTREWRIWDKGVDASAEGAVWTSTLKRQPAADKLPWIIISAPEKNSGYEGPLPADVNSTLELLKKYGG